MKVETNAVPEHEAGFRRATFSDNGEQRFHLEERLIERRAWGLRRVLFLLCNPSTATEEKLDPTVARCRRFAMRWGFEWYEIANVSAFRTAFPSVLEERIASMRGLHPTYVANRCGMGVENDRAILAAADRADMVICGWGAIEVVRARAVHVQAMLRTAHSRKLHHLGLTKEGYPKHPLARGKASILTTQEPIRWE